MVFKKKRDITTELAWDNLLQRLDRDGLLPIRIEAKLPIFKTPAFLVAAIVGVILICTFSGRFILYDVMQEKKLRVVYNEMDAATFETMLEDGSVVYLSEQTSLKYPDRFADDQRKVILQGEAFFEVSKQKERPFFIDTEMAIIEVIGTSFIVRNFDQKSFLLSVNDGEVSVRMKNYSKTVSVKTGETIFADAQGIGIIKTLTYHYDNHVKYVHFKDEFLGNVSRIINMHSDSIKLEIPENLMQRSLTVTLSLDRPYAMAEFICLALDLTFVQDGNLIRVIEND